MIKNYLLITLRSMMKNKLFILINVFGMGVAIACCIVAYFTYDFDASFDKMHKNGESLYRVNSVRDFENNLKDFGYVPLPLGAAIVENVGDADQVTRFNYSWSDFKLNDNFFPAQLAYVDPDFFRMFTFDFVAGNPAELNDKSSVFISDKMAMKLFATTDVVGKIISQIYRDELKEVRIAGVFKEQSQNSSFYFRDAYMNFENYYDEFEDVQRDDWKQQSTVFISVKDPSRLESVHKQLQSYVANNNKVREDFIVREFSLDHFPEMAHKDRSLSTNSWTHSAPPIAAVPGSAMMGILILLIACFNLTNTAIAISSRRLKEIGLRKVMGGLRNQLIVQFIGETMLICFFALLVGLALTEVLIAGWNSLWEYMKLTSHYLDSVEFVIFLIGVLLFTALLAGSYPAFYISKFEPVSILKGKLKFGGTNYFTRILLGLQYAISLVAIICAIAFVQNANYQHDYDLGFDVRGSIITYINGQSEFDTYRNALRENPEIVSIAGSTHSIFSSLYRDPVKVQSKQLEVDIIDVGDDYLKTMDLELIDGRDFVKDSETDRKESVIITKKMADAFGWNRAIGKELIWMDTVKLYVVGVVKDVYTRGLWREMEPMMIRYTSPEKYTHLIASAPSSKISEVNKFMESKWKEVFPNRLYNGRMLIADLQEAEEVNTNLVKMFVFLGIIAMLLSATGLFSLVSLNIIKRMKEIGVRKVLGASIPNITRIINTEFVIILLVASVLGSALSYLMADWLMGTIWRYYQGTTPFAFIVAVLVMFFISGSTIGYKVFSAASMNPVNTLRSE
ncbi:MAG TPA: ABC transporter permease [Cyclobacteriaceae bacterium]|nr:ABC transporter permease [Cyclobacteriaceae bacterium]